MKINGLNGTNTSAGMMGSQKASDSVSRNIQNQIARKQKELQELSSNDMLSVEEKMKRRQELQQEIADLNNQLRQHQIELRRERQKKQSSSVDDMLGGNKKAAAKKENKSTGLSQASMQAMISGDMALEQAQAQEGTVTRLEGRAGVLESEIKTDAGRGGSAEAKKQELAETEQKVNQAMETQMGMLGKVNEEVEAAKNTEKQTEKSGRTEKSDRTDNREIENEEKGEKAGEFLGESAYTHVDVYL